MSILIGEVHGQVTVLKIIKDVPHFPEGTKKGKIKWQATLVCPDRMKTFVEYEGSEEDLMKDERIKL